MRGRNQICSVFRFINIINNNIIIIIVVVIVVVVVVVITKYLLGAA